MLILENILDLIVVSTADKIRDFYYALLELIFPETRFYRDYTFDRTFSVRKSIERDERSAVCSRRRFFIPYFSTQALEMLEDIRKAFEGAVQELDWMDVATREKTLTKLHAIRAFVGYPGWIMNASRLDAHYKQVILHKQLIWKNKS